MSEHVAGTKPKKAGGKPWPTGTSGNPKGRKPDPRRKAEALVLEQAEALVEATIDRAPAGDDDLLLACFERVYPKERGVRVRIPDVITPEDAANALDVIIRHTTSSRLTPSEGATLAGLLESKGRAVERLVPPDTASPHDPALGQDAARGHVGAVGGQQRHRPQADQGLQLAGRGINRRI